MLNCCSEFASKYNVIFNPSKSKSIIFSKKGLRHYPDLYMKAIKLDNVQSVNHLGHIMNCDLSDDKDVTNQIHMYNRKANSILAEFKYISGDLRRSCKVFVVVTTGHNYGICQISAWKNYIHLGENQLERR